MKIIINTNYKSAATKVCVDDLIPRFKSAGHQIIHNDWNNYKNCDVVLFMAKDAEIAKARNQNPKAVIGIMDPKLAKNKEADSKNADFLLVSSIEQKDALLHLNQNIIIYFMFPDVENITKEHVQKEKTTIGYHGNKLHLHAFYPVISEALNRLSKKYPIELMAIYNIEKLGKWKKGLPKSVKVNHVQWEQDSFVKLLADCDIGIVNNLKPVKNKLFEIRIHPIFSEIFGRGYGNDYTDLITRYKYNTNPGRLYVFSQLSIPVISDFVPSACQFIHHEYSGLLANSVQGWYSAIESLILRPDLRNIYSRNLKKFIDQNYSVSMNFNKLNDYLTKLVQAKHD